MVTGFACCCLDLDVTAHQVEIVFFAVPATPCLHAGRGRVSADCADEDGEFTEQADFQILWKSAFRLQKVPQVPQGASQSIAQTQFINLYPIGNGTQDGVRVLE